MMKRSIVMTSDPFAMPVRGKGDRTAPIGPENRDSVSRQPLEDLGGRVPVVVVPTDADHGLARRELVQPLVRRRGPRPVMTDLQEVDAPHLPGQPAFHRQPRVGRVRSEEHTSELQSLAYLVCRLLLEKKKKATC